MSMDLRIDMPDLTGLGEEAMQAIRPRAFAAVEDVMMHLRNAIVTKVGGAGRGQEYVRTKDGKVHRASMPGDPPARDYGDYVQSWSSDTVDKGNVIEGQLGSSMWEERGQWLEHGTSKMAPRPHVTPTLEEEKGAVEDRLGRL
jgi:hypothetical protein